MKQHTAQALVCLLGLLVHLHTKQVFKKLICSIELGICSFKTEGAIYCKEIADDKDDRFNGNLGQEKREQATDTELLQIQNFGKTPRVGGSIGTHIKRL